MSWHGYEKLFLNQEIRNPFIRKRDFGYPACVETRSAPASLAATLAVLSSISEIPFLNSCFESLAVASHPLQPD